MPQDRPEIERRRILYSGRVQGVGFRATARGVAHDRAVTGWVRNEPDGRVYLEVQGAPAAIDGYLAALRSAMERNIRGTDAAALPVQPGESGFDIRY